jgi:hypothetical protein
MRLTTLVRVMVLIARGRSEACCVPPAEVVTICTRYAENTIIVQKQAPSPTTSSRGPMFVGLLWRVVHVRCIM